jgi:virulence factor
MPMATTSLAYRELHRGTLAQINRADPGPDDWQSVLTQRGSAAMLAHWYQQIERGGPTGR